jgi:hypothetical protein
VRRSCDLTAADLVASGQGNVTSTVLAKGDEVQFRIYVTGKIGLEDGGTAHILVVANYVINTADGSVRLHVDKFKVTPIGG